MGRYLTIMLRVSWDEKKAYERAAERAGVPLSEWMRSLLNRHEDDSRKKRQRKAKRRD